MISEIVKKIFEYDNYRFFMRDYFEEQKRCLKIFSHRYFAKKSGFSTSSFCAHVIAGERNLTEDSMKKVLKGMGLRSRKAAFFRFLVLYNQAGTVAEKESVFKKMDRLRKSSEFYSVKKDQYAYYDEWYYPVIRELAVFSDWNKDYSKLGSMVVPQISPERAKKAVETLLLIGILKKNEHGILEMTSDAVTAQDVPTVVTRKTRKEFLNLAQDAMEQISIDKRHISGVTVLMSEARFEQITLQLDELRKTILSESLDDDVKEKVFQFNFQAFPLSKNICTSKKNDTLK